MSRNKEILGGARKASSCLDRMFGVITALLYRRLRLGGGPRIISMYSGLMIFINYLRKENTTEYTTSLFLCRNTGRFYTSHLELHPNIVGREAWDPRQNLKWSL